MAERIVSPGVFTRERDLSFLPQAIGEIGAAIIGPTKKGPAFTPTQISNYQEFFFECITGCGLLSKILFKVSLSGSVRTTLRLSS